MRMLPWEYAVRNLGRSPVRLLLTVGSAALVSLLAVASAGFVRGMQRSLRSSGEPDNVMLVGAGSEESVERSEIPRSVAGQLLGTVSGLKETLGQPHVSPEVHIQVGLAVERGDAKTYPASLRGVTDAAFLVHPKVHVVQGRSPRNGADEIMVGRLATTRLGLPPGRLAIGQSIFFDERPWTVVGLFEAGGTIMDAEIWAPLEDVLGAARRTTLSCVIVTLGSAEFADLDLFAKQRVDLETVALRESDYYNSLSAFFKPIQWVAIVTAGLVALAGLFGGLNTMYAAFASRVRELAALQTVGFPRRAVLASLVQEAALAGAVGALIATAAGAALLDGLAVQFSLGAFGLTIDSPVLGIGLLAGLATGAIGALPPAWRCLRLPIPEALKAI